MCPHTTKYQASAYLFSFAGAQLETGVSRYSVYLLTGTKVQILTQPGSLVVKSLSIVNASAVFRNMFLVVTVARQTGAQPAST